MNLTEYQRKQLANKDVVRMTSDCSEEAGYFLVELQNCGQNKYGIHAVDGSFARNYKDDCPLWIKEEEDWLMVNQFGSLASFFSSEPEPRTKIISRRM